ncbi:hypothetical protein NDU88_005158 [Pleurodeles waltl]|uniref:Uncharacterized protein n=1 Tax=Pleurodeles waltl TaxID=8319 RepID=A0AAV7SL18_PLEWA|nr:hypothetical protein NDU88_005158 [Pleurodeles waltl]
MNKGDTWAHIKERAGVEGGREDRETKSTAEHWDVDEKEETDKGSEDSEAKSAAKHREAEEKAETDRGSENQSPEAGAMKTHPRDQGGAGEERAEAGRSGRIEEARHVLGGTWLDQVRDHLRGHLAPELRMVGVGEERDVESRTHKIR